MKIKGAIFDMDGTLLNSMDYWGKVATEFLTKTEGMKKPNFFQMFLSIREKYGKRKDDAQ